MRRWRIVHPPDASSCRVAHQHYGRTWNLEHRIGLDAAIQRQGHLQRRQHKRSDFSCDGDISATDVLTISASGLATSKTQGNVTVFCRFRRRVGIGRCDRWPAATDGDRYQSIGNICRSRLVSTVHCDGELHRRNHAGSHLDCVLESDQSVTLQEEPSEVQSAPEALLSKPIVQRQMRTLPIPSAMGSLPCLPVPAPCRPRQSLQWFRRRGSLT